MILTLIVLSLVLLGFLFGLSRGFKKSLVRLGVALLSAVLAFFLATAFAGAALNTPLSGVAFFADAAAELDLPADATVHEMVVGILHSNESIAQLTEAAPTLTNFITLVPQAIISEVLFIALFFIIKFLFSIPTAILTRIFLRGKGKRLLGGAIGALQGLVSAVVVLVPIFAIVPMVDSISATAKELPASVREKVEIVATLEELDTSLVGQIKSDPAYVVLNAVGVRSIGEGIFYGLSNVSTEEGDKVCVFGEIRDTLPVFVKFTQLAVLTNEDELTDEDLSAIRNAVSAIGDSALLSDTMTEVVTSFASALRDGRSFLGLSLPADMDASTRAFMNDLFGTLADSTKETLLDDLSGVVDLVAVFVKYDVLGSSGSEDSVLITELFESREFTAELLDTMVDSHLLAPMAVSAVNNFGIESLADALQIPAGERDTLKAPNIHIFEEMTAEERKAETERLTTILSGSFSLIESITNGFDFEENRDKLAEIGVLLDAMDDSALLSTSARGVMIHFLSMETVTEVMPANSIALMREKVQNGTIGYAATLGSISAAYEMADALHVSNPDLRDPEKLIGAVENLFTNMDETTAEIIKETINDEMLTNMGIPSEAADVTTAVLDSFFEEVSKANSEDSVDFEKEAAAIENVLDMITNGSSGSTSSEAVTEEIVSGILESETITNTIINVGEKVDLSEQLAPADKTAVAEMLDSYTNEAVDSEKLNDCLDAIRNIFGIH